MNSLFQSLCESESVYYVIRLKSNDWCRWKGTTYEEGTDDITKIKRLLERQKTTKIQSKFGTDSEPRYYLDGCSKLH